MKEMPNHTRSTASFLDLVESSHWQQQLLHPDNSDATNLFADFRVSKVFQQGVEVVVVVVDDRVRSDPLHHDFVGLVVELRLDEVPRL